MVLNILDFSEHKWHPLFKKHRFKTRFMPITKQFYDYLLQDGTFINPIYTRDCAEEEFIKLPTEQQQQNEINLTDMPEFPEVEKFIKQCLDEFNNKIFIKINWKSGKDCKSWLPELQCTHIEDVFMLLKCSEYISQILVDYQELFKFAHEDCNIFLTVRSHKPIDRAREFRCFVKLNTENIVICQRNPENVYEQLIKEEELIQKRISNFIRAEVIPVFNKCNFVVDVYLNKQKVLIVDIGPWAEFTNPLLYKWQELDATSKDEIRLVRDISQIMYEDLSNYQIPADFSGEISDMKQMIKQLQTNMTGLYM